MDKGDAAPLPLLRVGLPPSKLTLTLMVFVKR